MKKIISVLLIVIWFGCKSVKIKTDNVIDVTTEEVLNSDKKVVLKKLSLNDYEITFHTADPKQVVEITDESGNVQKFKNVKKATLKKKVENKQDSTVVENKQQEKKKVDKSIIKEKTESISDAVQYKWIGISLAIIAVSGLIIYLVSKFKKVA